MLSHEISLEQRFDKRLAVLDKLMTVNNSLVQIKKQLQHSKQYGRLDECSVQVTNVALEHYGLRNKITSDVTVSMERIDENIKDVSKAILTYIANALRDLKNFIFSLFETTTTLVKKVEKQGSKIIKDYKGEMEGKGIGTIKDAHWLERSTKPGSGSSGIDSYNVELYMEKVETFVKYYANSSSIPTMFEKYNQNDKQTFDASFPFNGLTLNTVASNKELVTTNKDYRNEDELPPGFIKGESEKGLMDLSTSVHKLNTIIKDFKTEVGALQPKKILFNSKVIDADNASVGKQFIKGYLKGYKTISKMLNLMLRALCRWFLIHKRNTTDASYKEVK